MKTTIFKGKILEVIQESGEKAGKKYLFEYAQRAPGTRLIIHQNDKILLTREFRRELNDYDYRLPGGKVFDTLAEYNDFLGLERNILPVAEAAAIKEAREEVGIVVKKIDYFATSICGTTVVWDLIYFVASQYSPVAHGQSPEYGEDISIAEYSLSEVKEFALSGKMQEDRSVAMLLRYLHNLK